MSTHSANSAHPLHPCLSCGACCATARVSFYWAEPVPQEFTEKVNDFYACMKGSADFFNPRCIGLLGEIGKKVECALYQHRPSPCRNFSASYENGQPNPRCDQARQKKGLPPLTPQSWSSSP